MALKDGDNQECGKVDMELRNNSNQKDYKGGT